MDDFVPFFFAVPLTRSGATLPKFDLHVAFRRENVIRRRFAVTVITPCRFERRRRCMY